MAPAPDASKPLTERLMALAQTLQFAWFAGHVTLLLCTLRYGLSYITFNYYSKWAKFSYRTAFLAAALTYGIVVYKGIRARARSGQRQAGGNLALITDENVQYLAMALVWLYSYQVPLALLPYAVYSVFHVATYTRGSLIPTITPTAGQSAAAGAQSPGKTAAKPTTSSSPLADNIGRFVKQYYDASMTLVAGLEIALWGRLLLSAITFARGTWVLLLIYTVFFRSRYSQSAFVQGAFHGTAARVDALVANQSTPPQARQAWQGLKSVVRQATDATDLRKYTGASTPVAPKKAQ